MCSLIEAFIATKHISDLSTGGVFNVIHSLRFYSTGHVSVSSTGDSLECASLTNFYNSKVLIVIPALRYNV